MSGKALVKCELGGRRQKGFGHGCESTVSRAGSGIFTGLGVEQGKHADVIREGGRLFEIAD